MRDIGPAVLNGGSSTFIAVMIFATSESHVFSSFFKVNREKPRAFAFPQTGKLILRQVFMLVVVFGLFHGLVVLPVLLSLVGPKPYSHDDGDEDAEDKLDADKDVVDAAAARAVVADSSTTKL